MSILADEDANRSEIQSAVRPAHGHAGRGAVMIAALHVAVLLSFLPILSTYLALPAASRLLNKGWFLAAQASLFAGSCLAIGEHITHDWTPLAFSQFTPWYGTFLALGCLALAVSASPAMRPLNLVLILMGALVPVGVVYLQRNEVAVGCMAFFSVVFCVRFFLATRHAPIFAYVVFGALIGAVNPLAVEGSDLAHAAEAGCALALNVVLLVCLRHLGKSAASPDRETP